MSLYASNVNANKAVVILNWPKLWVNNVSATPSDLHFEQHYKIYCKPNGTHSIGTWHTDTQIWTTWEIWNAWREEKNKVDGREFKIAKVLSCGHDLVCNLRTLIRCKFKPS